MPEHYLFRQKNLVVTAIKLIEISIFKNCFFNLKKFLVLNRSSVAQKKVHCTNEESLIKPEACRFQICVFHRDRTNDVGAG